MSRQFRSPLGPRFQLIPFSLGHWLEANDIPADTVTLTISTSIPDIADRMEAALRKDHEDLQVPAEVFIKAGMPVPGNHTLDPASLEMYGVKCAVRFVVEQIVVGS